MARQSHLVVGIVIVVSLLVSIQSSTTARQGGEQWNSYHTTEQAHALLERLASQYPNLTKLYSIGESLRGTPLMVLEISNQATGAAEHKPAYYYDGNIHAGELAGAEVALHFAWYVLTRYGTDERVTELVDARVLYVRPKFNPDGADIALTSHFDLRSTPRPYDEDGDGLLDEDPGDDLDGDGHVTSMRVPSPLGAWKISEDDPRIMVRRGDNDRVGTFFDIYSEGLDDDGDGAFNEDGVGGIDMNRNFPRNWGLEAEQSGAGPFPLSEPETRATIEFLNERRHVTGIFHGHTSGGFVYRLPSTTSWDLFDRRDQSLILEQASKYEQTTGQPVVASYTDPRVHRHGTLISWGYWDYGVVGFVPEFWGGFGRDYDANGQITETERLRWNEEELDGEGFASWTRFNHPQLGPVEIGGWRTRFTRQNPPPHLLRGEVELYVPWMLWLAEIGPRVEILDASVTSLGNRRFLVRATIQNTGYLPTNITQRAIDLNIIPPVRAIVDIQNGSLVTGSARTELGHLLGLRDAPNSTTHRVVEYVVEATGANAVVELTVESQKGGTVTRSFALR